MVANEVPRLGDVSVLGLQHSVKLSRTEAPLEELQSVLGLQRSAKVLSQSMPAEEDDSIQQSALEV